MSPFHLQRRFKSAVGLTPSQYARARREERLRQELRKGERVSRAVYGSGFGSSSRVYEAVTARMGMTPGRYAKGGLGMNIRYTIVPSQLGRLLVGATDTGICAVSLGSDDMTLERELRNEFPRAELIRVDEGADRWLGNLVRQVEHSLSTPAGKPPAIPLDIMGTAFQYRVWQALQAIPAGETRTYTEVAQAIRRPKAVRAVARACASNRVAVVVPCHRVVRSDGTLGGYRWGVERKKRLLAAERASA
jgi:AraC family transcriptional regulator of adaptative response/methylated-DNA-[protein]-cysteine methyltransferase